MLPDPFTPNQIANAPGDLWGRQDELLSLLRSLENGSVVIQGPPGVGKSSLVARGFLQLEEFQRRSEQWQGITVVNSRVVLREHAAELVVDSFADMKPNLQTAIVPHRTSVKLSRDLGERPWAMLQRLGRRGGLDLSKDANDNLIISIDEADKAPAAVARLIRNLLAKAGQEGIVQVRFVVAGRNPFFEKMIEEEPAIGGFFSKEIWLPPLSRSESAELLTAKFKIVVAAAVEAGLPLSIHPLLLRRIVAMSDGHPRLLQLLGSYLIEYENEDPDGVIDERDLANALTRICYVDRASDYDSLFQYLRVNSKLYPLKQLLGLSSRGFPTRIDRKAIAQLQEGPFRQTDAQWLIDHHVLYLVSSEQFGLVDEFLRIRMLMDEHSQVFDGSQRAREIVTGTIALLFQGE